MSFYLTGPSICCWGLLWRRPKLFPEVAKVVAALLGQNAHWGPMLEARGTVNLESRRKLIPNNCYSELLFDFADSIIFDLFRDWSIHSIFFVSSLFVAAGLDSSTGLP